MEELETVVDSRDFSVDDVVVELSSVEDDDKTEGVGSGEGEAVDGSGSESSKLHKAWKRPVKSATI